MYRSNPLWSDVTPIEQNDGPEPVVPINYTAQFKDCMDYFRAVLHSGEISQRAFDLTSDVIELNSANYTAWNYRRTCLFSLGLSIIEELRWVQRQAITSPKNYQLWHHRRVLADKLNDKEVAKIELEQTALILAPDAKNYHAWSHRQWLLQRFDLFEKELDYIDTLLQADVRNNSAWNQRYFVMKNTGGLSNHSVLENELKYTFEQIDRVPNNESAWNYLYGLLPLPAFTPLANHPNSLFDQLKSFTQKIVKRAPKCRHASSLLVDLYERNHEYSEAIAVCIQLAEHIDCIRMKYWLYRKGEIEAEKKKTADTSNANIATA